MGDRNGRDLLWVLDGTAAQQQVQVAIRTQYTYHAVHAAVVLCRWYRLDFPPLTAAVVLYRRSGPRGRPTGGDLHCYFPISYINPDH